MLKMAVDQKARTITVFDSETELTTVFDGNPELTDAQYSKAFPVSFDRETSTLHPQSDWKKRT